MIHRPARPPVESARARLRRWEVRPRRRLGQCFLVDRRVSERIAEAVGAGPGEPVIEIGAGTGELTECLLSRGARVWAVELDRALAARLRGELTATVVEADALETRFRDLVPEGPFVVTGNLPYYCTTDLLLHLLDQREGVSRAVFLVQREYADRLASPPGRKAYGSIGVLVGYFAQVERLFRVGPAAFHPRPEVQSAAIRLTFRPGRGLPEARERALFRIVRRAFQQRRKQLRAALRELVPAGRERLLEALARAGVDPARRGETLSLEEFMALAEALEGELA
ncbi:MAG TPA: 16S rRNA (adenine(1518)-N(6)/adenine(1519)-N(6))-dimethyltransferase RsmA [Candidatus Saccharimonadales bacterium]|nr:16S rRNA (adenine(1518)-N(6)/adenine(1519)-N(6))-dimethyltransferase RsmA [Candidatus Saccharimonadales bacterium]